MFLRGLVITKKEVHFLFFIRVKNNKDIRIKFFQFFLRCLFEIVDEPIFYGVCQLYEELKSVGIL
jgi:hypothetical protein